MKEIQLTQGKVAVVDDEDYEYLNQWKWHVIKSKENLWYAVRSNPKHLWKNGLSVKHTRMHRDISKVTNGKILVDHKDGNGLNNQKNNLRKSNKSQNGINRIHKKHATSSKYFGVYYCNSNHYWVASLKLNYKVITIGRYRTENEAATAYNNNVKKYHGKFAKFNTIL